VLLYLLHSSSEYLVWSAFWLAILSATLITGHGMPAAAVRKESRASEWLRSAHGVSALTILLVFLGSHIANHLTAIWSADFHKAVMNGLRVVYRSPLIQPTLVALMLFQIASGGALMRTRLVGKTEFFGALQTASGVYLGIFVISHLTAVFALGRLAMQIDTNWDFAIGAPAGMMGDPWNVRLVPHYSLAVLLLFSHLACGVRSALLGRRIAVTAATRTAAVVIPFGGAIAFTVTLAMLGLQVGPIASMHGHSSLTPLSPGEVV
jgi:hypothetical protein